MADGNSTTRHFNFKDLTGQQFGKWTVLKFHSRVNGSTKWLCRCECGTEKPVNAGSLRSSKGSRSCKSCANTTHGKTESPEYDTWSGMLKRCCNPNANHYDRYGGRGISVCERWQSFEAFFEDMGTRPSPKHSIERRNNDGNYEKSNCYWATPKEQARNKSTNRLLSFNGKTMCLASWGESIGIEPRVLCLRLRIGWSVERTLTTPVPKTRKDQGRNRHNNRILAFDGKKMCVTEWSEATGIPSVTLYARLKYGWSDERALTTPVQVHKRKS